MKAKRLRLNWQLPVADQATQHNAAKCGGTTNPGLRPGFFQS